jgi:glycosyltransferase involved in cell wall biosynthesis
MRVELIAPGYARHPGGVERHVIAVAAGLARRGARVEVLTQDHERGLPRVADVDGVVVRRFAPAGHVRVAAAPGLWDHLRRNAGSFDVVDVHGDHVPLALAVTRARSRRLVFTPHVHVQRLLRWPYGRLTRTVVERAARTVCTSHAEAEALSGVLPWASERIRVVPNGVDVDAIRAARRLPHEGKLIVAVGRLERFKRVDRAIAALANLPRDFRLVVVGDGPARRGLQAHACDLEVSSRVRFVGRVADVDLYRWLRTADVLVSVPEQQASGIQVLEAASARVPIVASDIASHREAAAQVDGAGVTFVSPDGSPFEVADAIASASRIAVPSSAPPPVPSWDAVIAQTCALYEELIRGRRSQGARGEPDLKNLCA